MMLLSRCGVAGVFLASFVAGAGAQDSAAPKQAVGWRHDGSGHFPEATPPIEWSDTKNIVWKTRIGPNKYSSPVAAGHRIFVTADPDLLVCVNAADGGILWQKSNGLADLAEKVAAKEPPANNSTPTPVTDGEFVHAVFGSGIVACYDMQGERRWIQHFPLKPTSEYGRAASPVLAGGKLFITLSCLLALDPKTGREVWRNKAVPECFGTPVAAKIAGVDVLAMPSGQIVRVSDGTLLAAGGGGLKFASPIVQDGTVYLMQTGSSARQFSAAAPDKWEAKTLWEQELPGTYYASPVCDKGLIYTVANEYKFTVLDAANGKFLVARELEFPAASDPDADMANMYSSLTIAGNRLFIFSDQGDALVLEPGREFRELRRNHLGPGHGGAPAFDGSHIFLRSGEYLYCIGGK